MTDYEKVFDEIPSEIDKLDDLRHAITDELVELKINQLTEKATVFSREIKLLLTGTPSKELESCLSEFAAAWDVVINHSNNCRNALEHYIFARDARRNKDKNFGLVNYAEHHSDEWQSFLRKRRQFDELWTLIWDASTNLTNSLEAVELKVQSQIAGLENAVSGSQ